MKEDFSGHSMIKLQVIPKTPKKAVFGIETTENKVLGIGSSFFGIISSDFFNIYFLLA